MTIKEILHYRQCYLHMGLNLLVSPHVRNLIMTNTSYPLCPVDDFINRRIWQREKYKYIVLNFFLNKKETCRFDSASFGSQNISTKNFFSGSEVVGTTIMCNRNSVRDSSFTTGTSISSVEQLVIQHLLMVIQVQCFSIVEIARSIFLLEVLGLELPH